MRRIHAFALVLTVLCAACAGPQQHPAAPAPKTAEDGLRAPETARRAARLLREGPEHAPAAALALLDAYDAKHPPTRKAPGSLLLRALALRLLGRYDEAVAAANRLILLDPNAADAFVERGLSLAALGRQERAEEDFDAALGLNPKSVPALLARGDLFFVGEAPDKAEADYSRAIELAPEEPQAWINRGVARDEQGRYAEAIGDFSRALALDPRSATAYANRGVSRSQSSDMAGMCADYRAACGLGACVRLREARDQGYCAEGGR
jgi:tetratricopeptide (TPR) repeat protein